METTVTDQAPPITREQLRTFHVACRGLDFAAPLATLRPAVLDQLQQLPAFESADLRTLYTSALAPARSEARTRFVEQLKVARAALVDLLALDALPTPEAGSPEFLSFALGTEGSNFFDSGRLAAVLRDSTNGLRRMDSGRRTRIKATVRTLDQAL